MSDKDMRPFPKNALYDLLDTNKATVDGEPCVNISNDISWQSRWSVGYTLVFSCGDSYYRSAYSVGATE